MGRLGQSWRAPNFRARGRERGDNRIDVFVRGHAYGLAQMTWTDAGGWTSWKNHDG